MSFAADVKKFTEKTKGKNRDVVVKTFVSLGTLIVSRTPIGDHSIWSSPAPDDYTPGTLVNSWTASTAVRNPSKVRGPNPTGAESLASINNVSTLAPGRIASILNPTPYANKIEYEGHSTQAPAGMTRRTAAEFKHLVAVAINGTK